MFVPRCFQILLLQISCMGESVDPDQPKLAAQANPEKEKKRKSSVKYSPQFAPITNVINYFKLSYVEIE